MLGKERVRPTSMIPAMTDPVATGTFAEQAPQTHPNPTIESPERPRVAVLEILKPTPQDRVQRGDDGGQAVARGAFRFYQ